MSTDELRAQSRESAPQIRIALGIWILGMLIILAVLFVWVMLSLWVEDYFDYTKSFRDAAADAGTGALSRLGNIEATKAWVMPLEILGISFFLFGFGFAFANILRNIRLRGATLAAVLPTLKERKPRG